MGSRLKQRHKKENEKSAPTTRTSSPRRSTSHRAPWKLVCTILALLPFIYLGIHGYLKYLSTSCLRKFNSPSAKDISAFDRSYHEQNLWGTYRPGSYLGLRMRRPKALVAGLMWFDPSNLTNLGRIRHSASQDSGLIYTWLKHNGRDFGLQHITDSYTDADFNTTWTRINRDWTARVTVSRPATEISFIFYLLDENGPSPQLQWTTLADRPEKSESSPLLQGINQDLGEWRLSLHSSQHKKFKLYKTGLITKSYRDIADEAKYALLDSVRYQLFFQRQHQRNDIVVRLHDRSVWTPNSNIFLLQITGQPPFEFDIIFQTKPQTGLPLSSLSGASLTSWIDKKANQFDLEFDKRIKISEARTIEEKEVFRAALSNLLGGIGYFYGQSRVKIGKDVRSAFSTELLTATPSRPLFPRGFLWDEGFHLLVVTKWDPLLAVDILSHWLDLMNSDGWIPREQILGEEAVSRVPAEFVTQDPTVGNPPTLFMALLELSKLPEGKEFLPKAWPRLVRWYSWIVENHKGKLRGSFRWTSRAASPDKVNPLTLDSGLDDYPRASHPSEDEYHLDIRCWIALAAKSMRIIGEIIGKDTRQYSRMESDLMDIEKLKKLHFDERTGWFLDYGLHTEKDLDGSPRTASSMQEKVAAEPSLQFIQHFGYVSLFPFFMKMFHPEDPFLSAQLDLLKDPNHLWTNYGLRSISRSSRFYNLHNTEQDSPYWRGPIWININYMAIDSLKHYSLQGGPYASKAAQIYSQLKQNVVTNVVKEYKRTGFFWEQYDDKTGQGKGCRPFNGWTSLIVLMD